MRTTACWVSRKTFPPVAHILVSAATDQPQKPPPMVSSWEMEGIRPSASPFSTCAQRGLCGGASMRRNVCQLMRHFEANTETQPEWTSSRYDRKQVCRSFARASARFAVSTAHWWSVCGALLNVRFVSSATGCGCPGILVPLLSWTFCRRVGKGIALGATPSGEHSAGSASGSPRYILLEARTASIGQGSPRGGLR